MSDGFRAAGGIADALRILILHDAPSCRITVKPCSSGVEVVEYKVEGADQSRAEFESRSGMWDLVIMHVHVPSRGGTACVTKSVMPGAPRQAPAVPSDAAGAAPQYAGGAGARPSKWKLGNLFGRKKPVRFEGEEQRASRSVFLAEMQRELGVAIGAIEIGDFDTVDKLARRFKREGADYNFTKISGLGAALSHAAQSGDIRTTRQIAQKLMAYLGKAMEQAAA